MTRIRLALAGAALLASAVAVAACGGGGAAASLTPPPDATTTIVAQNTQFTPNAISLPGGQPTKIFFKNLDGQPHNVAFYTDSGAGTKLFVGETITNAATVYPVPALQPGHYFFRCDVHPSMTGTVDVGA